MEQRPFTHGFDETSNLTWPAGSDSFRLLRQRGLKEGLDYYGRVSRSYFSADSSACDEDKDSSEKKVLVGICAMAKKSHSNSMTEIIRRLESFSRLHIVVFEEDVILHKPVEKWPVVNAFISFFSKGFPLDKAIAYKNLRQPFLVNDLEMQKLLQDRTEVYRILEENNIPHPRYTVLNKEKDPNCRVVETDDSIEVNGQLHVKPFVEKPIDAEDHNIYIYFPQAAGGGSTRLFRKVKDRSSVYSHTSHVRTNGAYLYEDFLPNDGTDVKIYTVGSDYQHAEARKSPCLDGKVERDANGKEVRYPILLSAREKVIARKVVWAFGQNVCGFDLLRASGKCYVCDVNGFSFVKTSLKYYDDCARILGTLMLRVVCPTLHIPFPLGPAPEDYPVMPTTSGQMMELRCVVALVRHGDRTPKQKLKMEVRHRMFFEFFERQGGVKMKSLKLKRPSQLQEALDIVRCLLDKGQFSADPDLLEKKVKLQQIKNVLEMYKFSGINRKLQFKWQSGRRLSVPCESHLNNTPTDPSLLLILKWGGELTPAGKIQAENLGKAFRTLYPGGQGQFEAPGLGFLRLHSTFRHDLKIYSSDEGRVMMTAAAFTKGLLALEGELTPILVQMVKSSNVEGMLDGECKNCRSQMRVKKRLQSVFNQDHDFTEKDYLKLNPTNTLALTNAMVFVKNPKAMCRQVYYMIKEITDKIRALKSVNTRDQQPYNGESWELLLRRWAKLERDFPLKNGDFQISKISDIYDGIKHDLQHNMQTLQYERAQELFMCSKALADLIIPQEYGITVEEKLHIAQDYCSMFLCKIRSDFQQTVNPAKEDSTTRLDSRYSKGVASPDRFVRTRLYFSSESHIHSVMNILRYGNIDPFWPVPDSQWERALNFLDANAEFNYMSQIVFMMYEDASKDEGSTERYHMELHFSPGAYTSCDEPAQSRGRGFRPGYLCTVSDPRNNQLQSPAHSYDTAATEAADDKPERCRWKPHTIQISTDVDSTIDLQHAPCSSTHTTTGTSSKMLTDIFMEEEDRRTSVADVWNVRVDGEAHQVGGSHPLVIVNETEKYPLSKVALDAGGSSQTSALSHRNYKTMHVPMHCLFATRWSMPCIPSAPLSGTVGALHRQHTFPMERHRLLDIKPVFHGQALEGFNSVPQLHPLETLHNTLTLHEVHEFLNRILSVEFPSPEASMVCSDDHPDCLTSSAVSDHVGPSLSSGKPACVVSRTGSCPKSPAQQPRGLFSEESTPEGSASTLKVVTKRTKKDDHHDDDDDDDDHHHHHHHDHRDDGEDAEAKASEQGTTKEAALWGEPLVNTVRKSTPSVCTIPEAGPSLRPQSSRGLWDNVEDFRYMSLSESLKEQKRTPKAADVADPGTSSASASASASRKPSATSRMSHGSGKSSQSVQLSPSVSQQSSGKKGDGR